MKKYKKIQRIEEQVNSITCDKCGKTSNYSKDVYQFQEHKTISVMGGYGSVFGDGDQLEVDFCQECLKEVIGKYLRPIQEPRWTVK